MKFIKYATDASSVFLVFPRIVVHAKMHESACNFIETDNTPLFEWELFSAGFIYDSLKCFGKSESLNTPSNTKDSLELLQLEMTDSLSYVVFEANGHRFPFIFSNNVSLAQMSECIKHIRTDERRWTKPFFNAIPVSAGIFKKSGLISNPKFTLTPDSSDYSLIFDNWLY